MKNFSIRHLENFSGIKAHTIRIWEQRFGLFQPGRSHTNIRSYSLEDVRLVLNVALLIRNGYKISELAALNSICISEKVRRLTDDQARRQKVVSHLIIYMYSHDIEQFEDILDSCVLTWDVDIIIKDLVLPFLEKVQLLSYHDTSCEAHFVVTAIRRKIILALEKVHLSGRVSKSALLFLPEGEHYDLMLLFISYILKKNGIKVWYLGTNISKDNLELIICVKKPDYLITYIPFKKKFSMSAVAPFVHKHLPSTNFVVVSCEEGPVGAQTSPNLSFVHYKDVEGAFR